MKVLIITYYWPPAGGSGVQRWLKFAKYLQDFGIEPIIYTVDKANYDVNDESLLDDIPPNITVLKQPIFEPNRFFKKKKVATATLNESPSFFQNTLQYIRGNYFIPDSRIYWIKPSVKYLSKYLENNKVDAIISTGPPHSMHLIAMHLKRRIGVKWIADFRDPMANLFYNSDLLLNDSSKKKLRQLEKEILIEADKIVVVGNHMKKEFQEIRPDVDVITNGYDSDLKSELKRELDSKFSISHIGLLPYQSNPVSLWRCLKELTQENAEFASDFELKFVGNVSNKVLESCYSLGLKKFTKVVDYVPHYLAKEFQEKSQLLLLLVPQAEGASGILTGKLFEYLSSNRPIVAIAPTDGDVADILNKTKSGVTFDFDEIPKLKSTILEYYQMFKENKLVVNAINIEHYHRKELTKELAKLIKSL